AILGPVATLGHHDGDGITDEADAIGCEGMEHGRAQTGWALLAQWLGDGAQILVRENGNHAIEGTRRRRVEGHDATVSERAAHERRMQHSGDGHVVDEAPATGEQAGVLDAGNARADETGHHGRRPYGPAARSSPFTVLSAKLNRYGAFRSSEQESHWLP